ncbi:MAG: DUF2817 domain-containing protein [Planctomycetes bacterium]|nr:DUF2817 domain-containing protein [Planctomycetota bacterium]
MIYRPFIRVVPLVALAALVGCKPPDQKIDPARPRPPASIQPQEIGRSVQGRPIEAWVLGDGPDVTLILATIHGDEPAGTPLVKRLADHLATNRDLLAGRRVIIVPVANPDGMVANTRTNSRGVDLNRNYPANNYKHNGTHGDKALSEPESVALHRLIERHRPARIISLHQPLRWGKACIDYDGPGKALAESMAAACDLPLVKIGARPGSLGSYAGETLGTPIITVELPRDATHWGEAILWERYGRMMLAALDGHD